jgi:hypothetical protein
VSLLHALRSLVRGVLKSPRPQTAADLAIALVKIDCDRWQSRDTEWYRKYVGLAESTNERAMEADNSIHSPNKDEREL